MADTESVLSTTTGTEQDDPVSDMSDEQLNNFIMETILTNDVIRNETEMFEKFLRRVEPKETANLHQPVINVALPPSEKNLRFVSPKLPSHGPRGSRKRSKSRSSAVDKHLKLSAEQKCDIAQRELEELREEIDKMKDDSERGLDNHKAVIEEADLKIAEVKKAVYEYDRDICKGAINPRTGKIVAEKVLRYYDDKLKSRDTLIEKLRLKNSTLKIQKKKLQLQLKQKEEMGEVLHEVDFQQLKIENQQYLEKIDDKNQELLKLKLMAGNTLQVLNLYKKKLHSFTTESDRLNSEIKLRNEMSVKFEAETIISEEERSAAEKRNKQLRQKLSDYKVPEVFSYVREKADLSELQKTVRSWERKVEIAQMQLKTHKKMWRQMWSQKQQPGQWIPHENVAR